jgi:hypothetical protein
MKCHREGTTAFPNLGPVGGAGIRAQALTDIDPEATGTAQPAPSQGEGRGSRRWGSLEGAGFVPTLFWWGLLALASLLGLAAVPVFPPLP